MTGSDAVELQDLSADPRVAGRLARYVDLLLEANRGLNLTAARTRAAVIAHVADSLAIAPFVRGPLIDIGSGGGFPAIPLAIALDIEVTLVESVVKKARFLEGVVRALGLAAAVRVGRAEDLGRDPVLRERFSTATARAVSSLPTVLELSVPFLRTGGVAVLQRGRLAEAERSAGVDAALMLGASLREEIRLEPGDGERRVLLAVKERPTPLRFPRRAGVPARRPLCYSGTAALDA